MYIRMYNVYIHIEYICLQERPAQVMKLLVKLLEEQGTCVKALVKHSTALLLYQFTGVLCMHPNKL